LFLRFFLPPPITFFFSIVFPPFFEIGLRFPHLWSVRNPYFGGWILDSLPDLKSDNENEVRFKNEEMSDLKNEEKRSGKRDPL